MKWALALSLVCVFGLALAGFAATLSGTWDTSIYLDPQETNFNDAIHLESAITVVYTVGDWSFTSVTGLNSDGWTGQDFSVAGVLGAFTIASDLDFEPTVPAFVEWDVNIGVSIAGVSFDVGFNLEDEDARLQVDVFGVAGDVTVDVTVTFGGDDNNVCDLNWDGIVIELGFPFCCADIEAVIMFSCYGFDGAVFSAGEISIPNLPWLSIDATLYFSPTYKILVLTPSVEFGDIACFDLYISIDYSDGNMSPLNLHGINIDGISLTCDIGAVTFTGATTFVFPLFGPEGDQEYFEYYQISTNDDACCGPFGFDLVFYFDPHGIRLFDIALIDANMTLQVASQFTFNMGLTMDVHSGAFDHWTLGFEVTW